MCGIAGYIAGPGQGRSSRAQAVLDRLQHRGPNDHGWLAFRNGEIARGREWSQPPCEPEVLLLHRRLSILDTSDGGWQPMGSPDGRHYVVYNGEIYNYRELREELGRLGHSFRSRTDTEVLLAAYKEWGFQALERFVGMFAFALLDVQRRTLVLVRDFFGIKPLYYSSEPGFFCFGSEIKALSVFGISSPQANAERVLSYLRRGVTDFGSQTLFSRVQQLPAGHWMEVSLETGVPQEPVCYWKLDSVAGHEISFDEAAQKVRELFLSSVQLHLRSDVALGTALSGGIDSSSVAMAVRHLQPDAEIHAFSYVAEEESLSEERWIDLAGDAARAHVHKVRVSAEQLAADFETMMRFHDEPCGGGSIYAQYAVFRAARAAGITVMLDGQGADEILGGYRHYLGARLASLLRQQRWTEAAQFLRSCSRLDGVGAYLGLAFCADHMLPPALHSLASKLAGRDPLPAWLNRNWFYNRGVRPDSPHYGDSEHVLRASLSWSLTHTLPGLLRYEDRNSMAFSVESRVPFLTPELVSFVHRLPEEYIIAPDGTSKAVFRQAMRGMVPDAILDRRDKIGYAAPEAHWLRLLDPWVRKSLESDVARSIPCLNVTAAQQEWDSLRDGRRPYNSCIWRCLDLIRWTGELAVTYS